MMTSRRETLHFDHPYLSREPLSDCHVCQKTAVLMMMMDSFVSEREMNLVSLKTIRAIALRDNKFRNDKKTSPGEKKPSERSS